MPTTHEPLLVNIIGHSVGTLLFGIFLFLVLQDRAGARLRGSWLSVTAAALACLWNAGSLLVLTVLRPSLLADLVTAVSFSALSLLPAVLLHLAVKGRFRPILATGYALSAVTVAMHFRELFRSGPGYHQTALLLITVGFIILTGAAVIALLRTGRPETRSVGSRAVGTMCLSLFAISFTHLGVAHGQAAWSRELAFHHAGIPLALFVLLQDYRFVLLDAFIRLMANVLLAALLTLLLIRALGSTLVRGIRGGSLDEVAFVRRGVSAVHSIRVAAPARTGLADPRSLRPLGSRSSAATCSHFSGRRWRSGLLFLGDGGDGSIHGSRSRSVGCGR